MNRLPRRILAIVLLFSAVALAGLSRQAAQPTSTAQRQPASKAAVVLTWNQAQREAGFAAMETLFRTRTVRAGSNVRPLPAGKALTEFAAGGERAAWLDQFIADQKVAGVLVVHDGRVRLERYALTG